MKVQHHLICLLDICISSAMNSHYCPPTYWAVCLLFNILTRLDSRDISSLSIICIANIFLVYYFIFDFISLHQNFNFSLCSEFDFKHFHEIVEVDLPFYLNLYTSWESKDSKQYILTYHAHFSSILFAPCLCYSYNPLFNTHDTCLHLLPFCGNTRL